MLYCKAQSNSFRLALALRMLAFPGVFQRAHSTHSSLTLMFLRGVGVLDEWSLQYVAKLADNLNAEIVQGTVQSVAEGAQWLGYTYLYVRMMQKPEVYQVPPDQLDRDPLLLQFRVDLVSG